MTAFPAGIGAAPRGIQNTLDGFSILNETIDKTVIFEQLPDQNGAIANEIDYDKRGDLSFTMYSKDGSGVVPVEGSIITYAGQRFKTEKVSEIGTYNTVKKWTVTAHRYENYPASV